MRDSRYKIVEPDKLLIATDEANGNKSVVAEYETTGSYPIERGIKINLEPIYQAPRFHGVKLNERLLLAFKTELNLKKKVIEIKSKEYEIISHKLTS